MGSRVWLLAAVAALLVVGSTQLNILDSIAPILKGAIEALTGVVNGVFDTLNGIILNATNMLPNMLDGVIKAVTDLLGSISSMAPSIINALLAPIKALLTSLVSGITRLITSLVGAIVGVVGKIISGVVGAGMSLMTTLMSLLQTLLSVIKSIVPLSNIGLSSSEPMNGLMANFRDDMVRTLELPVPSLCEIKNNPILEQAKGLAVEILSQISAMAQNFKHSCPESVCPEMTINANKLITSTKCTLIA